MRGLTVKGEKAEEAAKNRGYAVDTASYLIRRGDETRCSELISMGFSVIGVAGGTSLQFHTPRR